MRHRIRTLAGLFAGAAFLLPDGAGGATRRGSSPGRDLIAAAHREDVEALKGGLDSLGVLSVNEPGPDGRTALLAAAAAGLAEGVEALLVAGADAGFVATDGATALSLACLRGDLATVRLLLEAGAKPAVSEQVPHWNAARCAVVGGNPEVVKALSAAGFNPLADRFWAGEDTPLMAATEMGNAAMVELLLRAGAPPNETDAKGRTALVVACRRGDAQAARSLLAGGADPGTGREVVFAFPTSADAHPFGHPVLDAFDLAAYEGYPKVLELFLKLRPRPAPAEIEEAARWADLRGHADALELLERELGHEIPPLGDLRPPGAIDSRVIPPWDLRAEAEVAAAFDLADGDAKAHAAAVETQFRQLYEFLSVIPCSDGHAFHVHPPKPFSNASPHLTAPWVQTKLLDGLNDALEALAEFAERHPNKAKPALAGNARDSAIPELFVESSVATLALACRDVGVKRREKERYARFRLLVERIAPAMEGTAHGQSSSGYYPTGRSRLVKLLAAADPTSDLLTKLMEEDLAGRGFGPGIVAAMHSDAIRGNVGVPRDSNDCMPRDTPDPLRRARAHWTDWAGRHLDHRKPSYRAFAAALLFELSPGFDDRERQARHVAETMWETRLHQPEYSRRLGRQSVAAYRAAMPALQSLWYHRRFDPAGIDDRDDTPGVSERSIARGMTLSLLHEDVPTWDVRRRIASYYTGYLLERTVWPKRLYDEAQLYTTEPSWWHLADVIVEPVARNDALSEGDRDTIVKWLRTHERPLLAAGSPIVADRFFDPWSSPGIPRLPGKFLGLEPFSLTWDGTFAHGVADLRDSRRKRTRPLPLGHGLYLVTVDPTTLQAEARPFSVDLQEPEDYAFFSHGVRRGGWLYFLSFGRPAMVAFDLGRKTVHQVHGITPFDGAGSYVPLAAGDRLAVLHAEFDRDEINRYPLATGLFLIGNGRVERKLVSSTRKPPTSPADGEDVWVQSLGAEIGGTSWIVRANGMRISSDPRSRPPRQFRYFPEEDRWEPISGLEAAEAHRSHTHSLPDRTRYSTAKIKSDDNQIPLTLVKGGREIVIPMAQNGGELRYYVEGQEHARPMKLKFPEGFAKARDAPELVRESETGRRPYAVIGKMGDHIVLAVSLEANEFRVGGYYSAGVWFLPLTALDAL